MFLFFIFMLGVLCGCSKSVQVIIAHLLSWAIAGVFWVVIALATAALTCGILFLIGNFFTYISSFIHIPLWMDNILPFVPFTILLSWYPWKVWKAWKTQDKKT